MKSSKLFFFLALFSFSSSSFSEVINKIELNGLESISRGTVLNYLPVESGDDFSISISNSIIKTLYKTGLFKKIAVDFSEQILVINLEENPTIKYIDFFDYDEDKVLSAESIENIKKVSKLSQGEIYNEKNLDNLIRDIQKIYELKGYFNAKIEKKINLDIKNRIGIEIFIEENEPVRIKSFNFAKNKYFSSEKLTDQFEIGEPDFFLVNFFTEKDLYNENAFNAGIEKVKNLYLDSGFLDFSVVNSDPIINENNSEMSFLIEINEGTQYKFGDIKFDGDFDNVSEEFLLSKFDFSKGDFVDRKKMVSGVKKIGSLYRDRGYAFATIKSELIPSTETKFLDLIISSELGKKYYVNRISIFGNTKTQDDVIRRELNLLEGQRYSLAKIDESITRIKRLGFFSDVDREIVQSEDHVDMVNITVKVEESKTGEITVGLSHSNSTGASLNAGITQNNIFGTGNTLNAKFSNSQAVKELSFFFQNPKFNKYNHSVSYGYFNRNTDASGLDISSYILNENGFNIGYGIPINADSRLSAKSLVSIVDLQCGALIATSEYELDQCSSDSTLDFQVSLDFDQNSLNDFYFPTDGKRNGAGFILGLPLGDFKYWNFNVDHKSYYPLDHDLVFKFNSRLKLTSGYGGDELPFYKRFFEGGSSSVRGFDFNSIGAKYPNGNAKGGEVSFVSGISLSSPISNIANIDSRNIRISGFIDAGSLGNKFSQFEIFDELRASAGLQFTWISPIGPISIYGAQPIIKKTDDSTKNFSFELGSSF